MFSTPACVMLIVTGVQAGEVRLRLRWRFVVRTWVAPFPTPGQETITLLGDGLLTDKRGKLAERSCPSVAKKLSKVASAGPSADAALFATITPVIPLTWSEAAGS